MADQVVQWLNEIKDLKQELQAAQAAQEVANASADNWRKLYETEAQQRRTEAMLTRQTIDNLKSEIAQLQALPQSSPSTTIPQLERSIETLNTVDELKARLLELWAEHDRLAQDLKAEQADHAQTRKNLTTALGDTVDLLTKVREQKGKD
ncbi:MAG: hypothetical protein LH660_05145 [Phormidesmis sp. CAN_BIN36]|nr:hypothetical protein [Phormidesmis sp. CAN_BIN36]